MPSPPPVSGSTLAIHPALDLHSTPATMETMQPVDASTDNLPLTTLQPSTHRSRFLYFKTTARHAGSSDPTTRTNNILALLEAYRNTTDHTTLLPHDWDLFLSLQTRLAAATSPLTPESLHSLFELHKNATAHYASSRLIKRYISFVLANFAQLHGVEFQVFAREGKVEDPALNWTSLDSCPTFNGASSIYHPSSLPSLVVIDASAWGPVLGVEAVRWRIREAYTRCAYQLQDSQDVWKLYLAFEESLLSSPQTAREQQLETIRHVYLARLRVPHAAIEDTFQAFSGFVTHNLPPQLYESEMTAANTIVAESRTILRQREQYEDTLTSLFRAGPTHVAGSRQDLDNFAAYVKPYLRWQSGRATRALRGKDKAAAQTELDLTCALYERLIPCFGLHPPSTHREELVYYAGDVEGSLHSSRQFKRLAPAEKGARTQQEQQLHSERLSLATELWLDYISILTSAPKPDASLIMDVLTRSVHCLPTAASLYCGLMRGTARFRRSKPSVEGVFEKAISPGSLTLSATDLTDLCLARIDCERELATYERTLSSGEQVVDLAADMEKFTEIYALLSYSLSKASELGEATRGWDPTLRLEKCTVGWVERAVLSLGGPSSEGGQSLNELAEAVWVTAVKQQPDNALVYHEAAGYWVRRGEGKKARGWYKSGVSRLERKQQVGESGEYGRLLEDWVGFEHGWGSVEEVETAERKEREERKRVVDAWYAQYAQYQEQGQTVAATNGQEAAMQVEPSTYAKANVEKRKAEDDEGEEGDTSMAVAETATLAAVPDAAGDSSVEQAKKTRTADSEGSNTRDREHCSVLISSLPLTTDAASIRTLLRGCGRIVELSGPITLDTESAALVEFSDPASAASALTRHSKPLPTSSSPVSIFIGWKCTLFVTNFPEEWDDSSIRSTFSPYGLIFNVRWPSKRFSSSRRFCYVQFTTPSSASAAIEALNSKEVAEGRMLNVALSDPSRRKQRSDANENAKELFVSGLPRNITDEELKTYFEAYGKVTGVRLLRNAEGGLRGIGFVDFENALDATRAMKELNSTKWRGKTISVTIADSRSFNSKQGGVGGGEERRKRSARVIGLPVDAQEALIQQALEKELGRGSVKQVLWKPDGSRTRATVEFREEKDAGRAVLVGGAGGLRYAVGGEDGVVLGVMAMDDEAVQVGSPTREQNTDGGGGAQVLGFVPRSSRGARGRGRGRAFATSGFTHATTAPTPVPAESSATTGAGDDMEVEPPSAAETSTKTSGQDRFRAMLAQSSQPR